MQRQAARSQACGRQGFTLWELLLVLAILLVVAAIAWPAVVNAVKDRRLKQASQIAWTEITAARMLAIETGTTYQFRYEPGGARWVVYPLETDAGSSDLVTGITSTGAPATRAGNLPEGILFGSLPGEPAIVESLPRDALAMVPGADFLAGANWSPPVTFFVDGSSHNAGLRVMDETGYYIPLIIRGLTGAVTVGKPQRETVP